MNINNRMYKINIQIHKYRLYALIKKIQTNWKEDTEYNLEKYDITKNIVEAAKISFTYDNMKKSFIKSGLALDQDQEEVKTAWVNLINKTLKVSEKSFIAKLHGRGLKNLTAKQLIEVVCDETRQAQILEVERKNTISRVEKARKRRANGIAIAELGVICNAKTIADRDKKAEEDKQKAEEEADALKALKEAEANLKKNQAIEAKEKAAAAKQQKQQIAAAKKKQQQEQQKQKKLEAERAKQLEKEKEAAALQDELNKIKELAAAEQAKIKKLTAALKEEKKKLAALHGVKRTLPDDDDVDISAVNSQSKKRPKKSNSEPLFCICKSPNDNSRPMIGCEGESCPYGGWLHTDCIGNNDCDDDDDYYCPACVKHRVS